MPSLIRPLALALLCAAPVAAQTPEAPPIADPASERASEADRAADARRAERVAGRDALPTGNALLAPSDPIPREVPYQGVLTDGGAPVTTATPTVFRLHDALTGGSVVWSESQTVTPDADGRFAARLGSAVDLPDMSQPLWLSVTADGTVLGPRTPLGAAPYALALFGLAVTPDANTSGDVYAPNLAGGSPANVIGPNLGGATISGGGGPADPNTVTASFGTIGGGNTNTAGGAASTIGGGAANTASGSLSTVGGGRDNDATARSSTIGGGDRNRASGLESTVAGGELNVASTNNATVGGGFANTASGTESTVGGGENNEATGNNATVGGGSQNTASSLSTAVGGGSENTASGSYSAVGGGSRNNASGSYSAVGGGSQNNASGSYSAVGGGSQNTASGSRSAVGGGDDNEASGVGATVPGGEENSASGRNSFAAGYKASAEHAGSFVWNSQPQVGGTGVFSSTAPGQFLVNVFEGVGINEDAPLAELHIEGNRGFFVPDLAETALENEELIITADDAVAGLYSSANGTWGSALSFGEMADDGTLINKWGIARRTGATGGLYFTFGTSKNYAGNDAQMRIDTDGSVHADGSFTGGGADLAEFFPLAGAAAVAPGQVVGLTAGRVSLATDGAEQIAVISSNPAFIGNPDAEAGGALVALVGQVAVDVAGDASPGDLLIASGAADGRARAVSPADYTPADGAVLGRVLTADADGVIALVGVDEAAALRTVVQRQADHIARQTDQIDALGARLARLEALLTPAP